MTRVTTLAERVRNSFWAVPAVAIAAAFALGLWLPGVDPSLTVPDPLGFSATPETARSTLSLIATVAVSVAGVSFSVIVVALVLASQQLSPRVLQSFQRHPLNQSVLAVFLATAAYSIVALKAVQDADGDEVPQFAIFVATLMAGASLTLFVFFLHHMVRSLNAAAVIRRIAADGHEAVDGPYPAGAGDEPADSGEASRQERAMVARFDPVEVRAPRAGYVGSFEAGSIVRAAQRAAGFVRQEARIGDFVVTGALLARVWAPERERDDLAQRVQDAFVLNEERVVDDDIGFPIRQLVDIALKGLSPGINDPATAENAMDSVTDTLVRVARQPPPSIVRASADGVARLRARTLSLDDLVRLGFDQPRQDGVRRPSFSLRLLQLLADLRDNGGIQAAQSAEIGRQARLICRGAAALADIRADAEMVEDAYRRLHEDVEAPGEGPPPSWSKLPA